MLSHILQKMFFKYKNDLCSFFSILYVSILYADKQKPNDGRVLLYFCTSMEMSRIIA